MPIPGPTYSAAATIVPGGAGDFLMIQGSSSRIIRMVHLIVSAFATAAGEQLFQVVKRSTADTGGTGALLTAVPHDSTDPPATAVLTAFSGVPAAGAVVGLVANKVIAVPSLLAPAINADPTVFDFGATDQSTTEVMLRGAAETLVLGASGLLVGATFAVYCTWTEQ
jgi:hypothetical protein